MQHSEPHGGRRESVLLLAIVPSRIIHAWSKRETASRDEPSEVIAVAGRFEGVATRRRNAMGCDAVATPCGAWLEISTSAARLDAYVG
jgi:hypothetical protein